MAFLPVSGPSGLFHAQMPQDGGLGGLRSRALPPEDPAGAAAPAMEAPKKRSRLSEFGASPYLSQALLAMSKGFFDGDMGAAIQGFGQGVHGFNSSRMKQSSIGGPDDSFEITVDPVTGERTYTPITEFQEYKRQQAEQLAGLKKKEPEPRDTMDAVGRLASVVQQFPPEKQAAAWAEGRKQLEAMGFNSDTLPENFDPTLVRFGATVPQQQQQVVREGNLAVAQGRLGETVRHNGVMEGQGAQRIALSAAKGRGGGGGGRGRRPGGKKAAGPKLPAGFILD